MNNSLPPDKSNNHMTEQKSAREHFLRTITQMEGASLLLREKTDAPQRDITIFRYDDMIPERNIRIAQRADDMAG